MKVNYTREKTPHCYVLFVSIWFQRFCKSQRVSLMREQVANWFNFSRHNAIFLPKLQTVFAILNILQSVLWNNLFNFTKQGLIYICLLTFITQVEHFKKDFTFLKMQFETECECVGDGDFSDYRGKNHFWFPSTERNTSSSVEGEVEEIFTTDFHPRSFLSTLRVPIINISSQRLSLSPM